MANSALSVGLVAFLLGVMVSTFTPLGRGLRQSTVGDGAVRFLTGQPPKPCLSLYSGYPLSPVYNVAELQPGKHPIPGLEHVTISGRAHHGNRGLVRGGRRGEPCWCPCPLRGAECPPCHYC